MLVTPAPVTYTASNPRSAMMRAERALAAPGTSNARRAVTQAAMRSRRNTVAVVTQELFCVHLILVFPSDGPFFAQCRDLIVVVSQSVEPPRCVLGEPRGWRGRNGRFGVELKACTGHVLGVGRCPGCPVATRREAGAELAFGTMLIPQNPGNPEYPPPPH